jgi:hypothetical protein
MMRRPHGAALLAWGIAGLVGCEQGDPQGDGALPDASALDAPAPTADADSTSLVDLSEVNQEDALPASAGERALGAQGSESTRLNPNLTPKATVRFTLSGAHAGGAANVIAADVHKPGWALLGTDVAGLWLTSDWGKSWRPVNRALTSFDLHHIASVAYSPSTAGKVYAGFGDEATTGGLLRSSDHGLSWSIVSTAIKFSGVDNPGQGTGVARSTGRLFEFDAARGRLYAGSYDQGLLVSTDDGATWASVSPLLVGKRIRGLAQDRSNPLVLYVATYDAGLFRVVMSGAAPTGTATALVGSPLHCEELAISSTGRLFVAASDLGLVTSSDGGVTFTQRLAAGSPTAGPFWQTVAVVPKVGGGERVWAGCERCGAIANGYTQSLRFSDDDGVTWQDGLGANAVSYTVAGSTETWWRSPTSALVQGVPSPVSNGLGATASGVTQLAVHPTDPAQLLLANLATPWVSTTGGATWAPAARGLGLTVAVKTFVDLQGTVWFGLYDWSVLASTTGGATVTWNRPQKGTATMRSFSIDPETGRLYTAESNQPANNNGEGGYVYSRALGAAQWTVEGSPSDFGPGPWRPLEVVAGRDSTGQLLLVAAMANLGGTTGTNWGVWRRLGTQPWQRVLGTGLAAPLDTVLKRFNSHATLLWAGGAAPLYLYDRWTGLWRSSDLGATWSRIWTQTSPTERSGYVVADPLRPDVLWASTDAGLFMLEGASSTVVATAVPLPAGEQPGPLAVRPSGRLYLTVPNRPTQTTPRLYSCQLPTASTKSVSQWRALDDALYQNGATMPTSLSVTAAGKLYVSLFGGGFLVGSDP